MKDYLFKFGSFVFPMEHIADGGWNIAPNQRQDINPYTDANGVTHRQAVEHTKTTININTLDIDWDEMDAIMQGITDNYINRLERDAECDYYDTETRTYKTGHFYLDPSVTFSVKEFGKTYAEMTWTFIEY